MKPFFFAVALALCSGCIAQPPAAAPPSPSPGRYVLAPLTGGGVQNRWTWVLDTQTGDLTAYELVLETGTAAVSAAFPDGYTVDYSYINPVGHLTNPPSFGGPFVSVAKTR
jgi:hypothetical protein